MNPYREAFYSRQAEWHGYEGVDDVRARHETRADYYRWYTKGWLDHLPLDAPVLDIGCGSGQFLYFLRKLGHTNLTGLDVDANQVALANELGLNVKRAAVLDFLADNPDRRYGLVAMLDILEHFTREELFPILNAVADRLQPGGLLVCSVPNADSPHGLRSTYADITHEISFTPTSLSELMFCHGLKVKAFRDPWPAPISPSRAAYRALSNFTRRLEAVRLRLLGFDAPQYWSSVIWALAEKPATPAGK